MPSQATRSFRFECQRGCIRCCDQKGYVYLSEGDVPKIAAFLELTPAEFELHYVYRTKHLIRLRTPRDSRCRFLTEEGCGIHDVKPTQCRAFPFWPEMVESEEAWEKTGEWCPGIGVGELVTIQAAKEIAQGMREAYPRSYGMRAPLTMLPRREPSPSD